MGQVQTEELVKKVRELMAMRCTPGAIAKITKQSKTRISHTIAAIHMVSSGKKINVYRLKKKQHAIEAQLAIAKLDRAYAKHGAAIQPDGKVKLREPA